MVDSYKPHFRGRVLIPKFLILSLLMFIAQYMYYDEYGYQPSCRISILRTIIWVNGTINNSIYFKRATRKKGSALILATCLNRNR